ncbi:MAG: AraC family transcriptional regulator [Anaerolineae bacterium]|nr:AraC family transcriptional regulator [Anaerolineae bacterium]
MSVINPTAHYTISINRVLDYIRDHLIEDLSLDVLAGVAGFSPFHFHRIAQAMTGETLAETVARLRLERAAALLRADRHLAIAEAALASGFISQAHFSRAFKKHFGLSPRQWDRVTPLQNRKNGQILEGFPLYTFEDDGKHFEVRLREQPLSTLAYIRVINAYSDPSRIMGAFDRLLAWYQQQGGDLRQTTLYGMSQDDPEITPLEKCRFDFCLSVPVTWRGNGEISLRELPACHLAYIHCVGDIYLEDRAWQYLYRYWLPRSRFMPVDLPAMEIYHKRPDEIGWATYDIDCAIPVIAV